MKLSLHKVIGIALVLALALSLTLVGCSDEAEVEETVIPVKLVVEPASTTVYSKAAPTSVSILGSGLPAEATVKVKIVVDKDMPAVGVNPSLTPSPEVNDLGAFASVLSLNGYAAGVYTVQLTIDEEVVATAPLSITEITE